MTNSGRRFRLDTGVRQLEDWADRARQGQKNQLYKALFAVTDGSVFRDYAVLEDVENPNAHFILVREDLVLKVVYTEPGSFGILYIGPLESAPGLDLAIDPS
ncbi:MAG: DUF6235 family protein [Labedaea sp.]